MADAFPDLDGNQLQSKVFCTYLVNPEQPNVRLKLLSDNRAVHDLIDSILLGTVDHNRSIRSITRLHVYVWIICFDRFDYVLDSIDL